MKLSSAESFQTGSSSESQRKESDLAIVGHEPKKNCGTRLNHVGGSHVSQIDAMPLKVETLDRFHFLNL